MKTVPDGPHVTVSRGRKLGAARRSAAFVHRAELSPTDVVDGVTTQRVTLRDCLRMLAFDEALAVADSALRESGCARLLEQIAEEARGPGARQIRRVASLATAEAANALESVLRAIAISVPGLVVEPQVTIRDGDFTARPDLVDRRLRLVLEADSFEWHGRRSALASDCRRYNRLVVGGWVVQRFCYEGVMFRPDDVRSVLTAAVALAEFMIEGGSRRHRAA